MRLAALDVRDPTLLSHENLIEGGSFTQTTRPKLGAYRSNLKPQAPGLKPLGVR